MTKFNAVTGLALSLAVAGATYAQERIPGAEVSVSQAERGKNSESLRPINEEDIMYKTTLWRRIDLQETQNQPFFSTNNEITRYLIDGMKAGVLNAYKNDSLTTKLSPEQFLANLTMENTGPALSDEEKAAGFGNEGGADDGWGDGGAKKPAPKPATVVEDDGWGNSTAKKDTKKKGAKKEEVVAPPVDNSFDQPVAAAPSSFEYFPTDITVLEMKEDYVFDKRRSRQYYDVKSVTLIIPAAKTSTGLDREVATFSYKELDRYFRSNPTKFIWFNNQNNAKHLNMADAFDLRLFSSRILKQSNSKNAYLSQVYGGEKEGLVKAQQLEYKLMEWEHNLWEY